MDSEMKRDSEANEVVDEKIADLLSKANVRPVPHDDRKEEMYLELHSEWLASNLERKTKRRYVMSGLAASIIAAVVLVLQGGFDSVLPVIEPDAVLVRSIGSGTTVNGHPIGDAIPVNAPLRFQSGDTITTGSDAAVAINWNSLGSLRVSSSSSLTLVSNDRIQLLAGEIYYDSLPGGDAGSTPIVVDTRIGQIHHVGTQFLTNVDDSGVRISVREGRITFGSASNNIVVRAGESAHIDSSLSATFFTVAPVDGPWTWVSMIAPELDTDGLSTYEIIQWLSRETGLAIKYENDLAKEYASSGGIRGIGEIEPTEALTIIPIATELRFVVDHGVIRIGMKER